jgi:flagellar hook-associated protein FlgK
MSDLLSIGRGGVQVYQRALGTTSNNIANLATEGYSRQETTIVDNVPRQDGPHYLGTGSIVDGIGRNFDAFIEQSLRSSISDLETQVPLIDYTDRVVDILGSQRTGLTGALDSFFSAARAVSSDAASPELRATFLSEADGLAQRLRTLGGQLDVLNTETSEALQTQLDRINTLSEQLAKVNAELNRRGLLVRQAPRLLDQRDSLLRELSSVVKIRVTESVSGAVDISIGTTNNRGKIVEGKSFKKLDAEIDPQTLGVKLVLDKIGKYEVVSGVGSGALGGVLAFRDQILDPSVRELDFLAQTIATQFNSVHRLGMDATGKLGDDLFTIDPVFALRADTTTADLGIQWEVVSPADTRFHSLQLEYDPDSLQWTATDMETGASASGQKDIKINGMLIRVEGRPIQRETVTLEASNRPAVGIRRLIEDPRMVAAAAPFRIIEDPMNPSGLDATIAWQPDQSDTTPLLALGERTQSNRWQTNTQRVDLSGNRSLAVIGKVSTGQRDIDLGMASDIGGPVELEVFTRDGRHLAGSLLSEAERAAIVDTANGFVKGATYSGLYRNTHGEDAYLDMSILRGARARPVSSDIINSSGLIVGSQIERARLVTERIPAQTVADNGTLLASAAIGLNGNWLDAFSPPSGPGGAVLATDAAAWLSAELTRIGLADKIQASAVNEVRADPAELRLDRPLSINGVDVIPAGTRPASAQALVDMVNQVTVHTNVRAHLGEKGEIVLTNDVGFEGADIEVGPANDWLTGKAGNALGLSSGNYAGRVALTALDDVTDIRLEIGPAGDPSALARLGLSTHVYIDGQVPEDLIVVAKGGAAGAFSVAQKSDDLTPLRALREREMSVTFTSDTRYQIVDVATNTLLAEREYNALDGIRYRGIQIGLSRRPADGDTFLINGNHDGVGDNSNILRLASLESSRNLVPGGLTIAESWHGHINEIGNLGNQARIAQEALKVVNDQAVEARDRVSGVSLDEEAADLIRFQQAYQASARIIQTANTLFEAVLQVR